MDFVKLKVSYNIFIVAVSIVWSWFKIDKIGNTMIFSNTL